MLTTDLKMRIVAQMGQSREMFGGSDAKFAASMGINAAQYSRIKNGDVDKVLADAVWITLARKLDVQLTDAPEWKTAGTPVYRYITSQMFMCQEFSTATLLCDLSDIGKSYAARSYAKTHKNVAYIDCSQPGAKEKRRWVREVAKSFGVNNGGFYRDVYQDLVFYLKTLEKPLIILDEAGDMDYDSFLEIKALWNATEGICGWYMMGADGLREKMERCLKYKKVGYAEIFSRFGRRYCRVFYDCTEVVAKKLKESAAMIIQANAREDTDVNKLLNKTVGDDGFPSLRRIYKELVKVGNGKGA